MKINLINWVMQIRCLPLFTACWYLDGDLEQWQGVMGNDNVKLVVGSICFGLICGAFN